jgi:hypothetical protein
MSGNFSILSCKSCRYVELNRLVHIFCKELYLLEDSLEQHVGFATSLLVLKTEKFLLPIIRDPLKKHAQTSVQGSSLSVSVRPRVRMKLGS